MLIEDHNETFTLKKYLLMEAFTVREPETWGYNFPEYDNKRILKTESNTYNIFFKHKNLLVKVQLDKFATMGHVAFATGEYNTNRLPLFDMELNKVAEIPITLYNKLIFSFLSLAEDANVEYLTFEAPSKDDIREDFYMNLVTNSQFLKLIRSKNWELEGVRKGEIVLNKTIKNSGHINEIRKY